MTVLSAEKLPLFNANLLHESPEEIISFALSLSTNAVLTTSFGRFSEALIYALNRVNPQIETLWCDTGYNPIATYAHAKRLTDFYQLNLNVLTPKYSRAYTEFHWGAPGLDNPNHDTLSKILKIDPIQNAFKNLKPDVWFTNIRKGQTSFRDQQDVLSLSPDGVLKVSPFYHCTDHQIRSYLKTNGLVENTDYFDPVKALDKRECGIHFSN